MADDILPVLVGVLGGGLVAAATLAIAYVLRRLHELQERMLVWETRMDGLKPLQDLLDRFGIERVSHALGGGRRAR